MSKEKHINKKPLYLVSACLVGLPTRYDGASRPSVECLNALEGSRWIPVCPEQLGGLPTPRVAADLCGGQGEEVLDGTAQVITRAGIDVSEQFLRGAELVLKIAESQEIAGIFLKGGSPSCGVGKVLGVTAALLKREGYEIREF